MRSRSTPTFQGAWCASPTHWLSQVTVGDRDWRVVWRVERDEVGNYLIDVTEVWAVGYRKDSEVYTEIKQRIADAGSTSKTRALSKVLGLFAKQARDLTATPEPGNSEPVPKWLTEALLYVVRIPASQVDRMSLGEAEKAWTEHISGTGTGA